MTAEDPVTRTPRREKRGGIKMGGEKNDKGGMDLKKQVGKRGLDEGGNVL